MTRTTPHRLDRIAGACLVIVTCLIVATLPLGAVANAPAERVPRTPRQTVHGVEHRLELVRMRVVALERVASRFRIWMHCIRSVPVDQIGDDDHRSGFLYNQLDGTGVHPRRALVLHDGPGRAPFALLAFAPRAACWSAPVTPNGTGADAKGGSRATPKGEPRPALARAVRELERWIVRLEARVAVLERVANRFDEWESCLSAIALTEQGDPGGRFGFHFAGIAGRIYRHALDVDTSEWDDPDYQLLGFVGRDRPFGQRECSRDPGEAPDKAQQLRTVTEVGAIPKAPRASLGKRLAQVAEDSRDLAEDIPDLRTALSEFSTFDQCMFTIGVSNLGDPAAHRGYLFAGPGGKVTPRRALALALDGEVQPRWQFLAFPGEEPPQIECNEDAGGQDTEE